jgi:hypothetical protein
MFSSTRSKLKQTLQPTCLTMLCEVAYMIVTSMCSVYHCMIRSNGTVLKRGPKYVAILIVWSYSCSIIKLIAYLEGHQDTQYNNIQHNHTQPHNTKHNNNQHNNTHYNTTLHIKTQRKNTQHSCTECNNK